MMKNLFNQIVHLFTKVNKYHIQLFLLIISLILLVIGAGAPDGGGVPGCPGCPK
jgi:hypothetical protein